MKEFHVYIDENLPPQIARGLHILQEPLNEKEKMTVHVHSIKESFGQGAADETWIPQIGKVNGIVITQDYRIQTIRHQRELYKQHGVGVFFFSPPSKHGFLYWEMVKQIIERWENMKTIFRKHKTPFAYRCSARTPFEKITD
jgi:hypothetical protein